MNCRFSLLWLLMSIFIRFCLFGRWLYPYLRVRYVDTKTNSSRSIIRVFFSQILSGWWPIFDPCSMPLIQSTLPFLWGDRELKLVIRGIHLAFLFQFGLFACNGTLCLRRPMVVTLPSANWGAVWWGDKLLDSSLRGILDFHELESEPIAFSFFDDLVDLLICEVAPVFHFFQGLL